MGNQVFRQKSLEQLSNVKASRDYLHAPSPRVWMLLSVVLALALGSTIYAFEITRQNTVQAVVTVSKSLIGADNSIMTSVTIDIPQSAENAVHTGTPVMIGDIRCKLDSIWTNQDGVVRAVVLLWNDEAITTLDEGTYDAEIILDSISPLGFLSS